MHLAVAPGSWHFQSGELECEWHTFIHFCCFLFFLSGNKDEAISMVSASAWDKRGGTWQRQKSRMGRRRRCISQKVICAVNWEVTISLHCKSFSIFSLTSAYLSFLLWAVAVTCYTDRVYKQRWELASALSLTMGRETALHALSPALCPRHFSCLYVAPLYFTGALYHTCIHLYSESD